MKFHCAILLALCFVGVFAKDCTIDLKDLPTNKPFFLRNSNVIYPTKTNPTTSILTFAEKEKFSVACSSETTEDNLLKFSSQKESIIECLSSGEFSYNQNIISVSQFECSPKNHEKVSIEKTGCGNNLLKVNIKFEAVTPQSPMIAACHDSKVSSTVMTSHIIHGAAMEAAQISNDRPNFKEGHKDLYNNFDCNLGYNQRHQSAQVADLVGSNLLGQQYINVSNSYYLARGHLAPDGDFPFVFEQDATYYYFNCVPQWQSINNGNWKALEFRARDMAKAKKVELIIYTGALGVLKLKDIKEKLVEIYLATDEAGNRYLPVPKLTWKVIYNPVEKKSVVIIMINNPHQTKVEKGDVICEDICSKISWVDWKNPKDFTKGYTYCCDLASFKKVVKTLPDFGPVELLN